ncbi:MAG: hypothetical protein ACK5WT_04945, partial [Betaproteobacteria bacterium]
MPHIPAHKKPPGPLLPPVSIVEQTMRQARRSAAATLCGAALWTGLLLVERLWSADELTTAASRLATAHEVVGRLRVTEQQLVDATEVASVTGDARWAEHYGRLVDQLGQDVEHASLLAPLAVAERHRRDTAAAAAEIAQRRASALRALRRGAHDSAHALFQGERYRRHSRLLREANAELAATSLAATEAQFARLQRRGWLTSAGAMLLALLAGAVLWRRLSKGLDPTRGTLRDAEVHIQRMASSDLL